jgi:hypothetical protein
MKKLSEMTDEERYGKVGAEIRRLDPEAYKNRPKTMEGNLKLLRELRAKSKETLDDEVEVKSKRPDFTEIYKRDTVTDKTGMGQRGPSGRGGKRNLNVDQKIGESIRATSAGFDKKYKDEGSVFSRLARGASFRKGGSVKSSASKRADGCAVRGKTRGKFV